MCRRPRERYLTDFLPPSFASGQQTLLVWAALSARGRTTLVRIEGRLNKTKYIDILHTYLLPFVEALHGGVSNFTLQEGNCGPHRAVNVGKYLALHSVRHLDRASQSPDMNPIENTRSVLETRLRARPRMPTSTDELFAALSKERDGLGTSFFNSLWRSMPSRVQAVVSAKGHATKYEVNLPLGPLEATFA